MRDGVAVNAIMAAVHLTLRMLRSIRLTNQKIKFYKLTNQKMLRSIRSAKWTAANIHRRWARNLADSTD